ncbi:MAG: LemA family protein [Muribaculaceae bacterium]|nr:LemA family protein [Muribaculaceae bacterium]MDE7393753.1 LemA family protein [Muribaculaceae bacterium]
MAVTVITAIVILLIILLWAIFTSNNLIAKRNRVKQCRSSICIAIKQRNDMIPNLVSSVKAYMVHENELLMRITELRVHSTRESENQLIHDGAELSSLLSRLNIAVENYPDLKADDQFMALQLQIADMERELQAIRRTCNAAITDYNNGLEMFPTSIVASMRHYMPEELIAFPSDDMRDINISQLFAR